MIYQGRVGYPVQEVILHTAATPGGWHEGKTVFQMRDAIRDWHVNGNGWRNIGYHGVFAPDGKNAAGRSPWEIGAHCKERNRGTIGLCMIPVRNHAGLTRFEDYFTEAQRVAVRKYIQDLLVWTGIRWVTGHNDYAPTECPGFKVKTEDWL